MAHDGNITNTQLQAKMLASQNMAKYGVDDQNRCLDGSAPNLERWRDMEKLLEDDNPGNITASEIQARLDDPAYKAKCAEFERKMQEHAKECQRIIMQGLIDRTLEILKQNNIVPEEAHE